MEELESVRGALDQLKRKGRQGQVRAQRARGKYRRTRFPYQEGVQAAKHAVEKYAETIKKMK